MLTVNSEVLKVIDQHPDGVGAGILSSQFGLSRSSLRRVLTDLRRDGLVLVDGKGPATRYRGLGPLHELREYIAQPVSERPMARYDPAWLEAGGGDSLRQIDVPPGSLKALDASMQEPLMIDFACASSALEGAHYSVVEAMTLIEYGEAAAGKAPEDAVLVRNHAAAFACLYERRELSDIYRLHALLTDDCGMIELAEAQHCLPRRYRGVPRGNDEAVCAGSSYQPPFGEAVLEQGIETILAVAANISHPLEASFYLATRIPYLQAFRDGNKRVARAMSAIPLLLAGWPPVSYAYFTRHDYLAGLLVCYELGDTRLAEEVFLSAYRKTLVSYRSKGR